MVIIQLGLSADILISSVAEPLFLFSFPGHPSAMKGTSVSSHDDVNDSDDEFLENKLVIDLDSSMTEKRDKKEDEFAVPDSLNGEMTSGKSKAKRGAPKPAAKNGETNATAAPAKNSRSVKTEKNAEKATPQKTGRKRREKKDQKSPVEELPAGDPYKFESQEEGVASTQTGKKSKVGQRFTEFRCILFGFTPTPGVLATFYILYVIVAWKEMLANGV